jgi:hypothetical protein
MFIVPNITVVFKPKFVKVKQSLHRYGQDLRVPGG